MPRTLPPGFELETNRHRHAVCVRVRRRDGFVIGLTSHDRPLELVGGLVCQPEDGLSAGAVETSLGSQVDDLQIVGLLRDARLTERDLLAGLWDDARVDFLLVNWADTQPLAALVALPAYVRGVTWQGGRITITVESLLGRLQQAIGSLCSNGCRVRRFRDSQCNPPGNDTPVSIAEDWMNTRLLASAPDDVTLVFADDDEPAGFYRAGWVHFNDGENAGIEREVKSHVAGAGTAILTLQLPFPFPVAAGDEALLHAGCDKTKEACIAKGNLINIVAEPFLPGVDKVVEIRRR